MWPIRSAKIHCCANTWDDIPSSYVMCRVCGRQQHEHLLEEVLSYSTSIPQMELPVKGSAFILLLFNESDTI
jgi:hypothetical protein